MGYSTMRLTGRSGYTRLRGLGLAALTILGVMAVPVASAQADALWAGAATNPEWATSTNWNASSTTPPTANNTAAGVITFPDLGSTSSCTTTCYTSHNGLTGISATGLVFQNTTAGTQYRILGNGIALSGPITDNSGGSTGDVINTPLAVSGTQNWVIGNGAGPSYNSLSLSPTATVTGSVPLSLTYAANTGGSAPTGDLFVNTDMEVGSVSVSGQGGLHIGSSTAPVLPGSVNGTNGNPVSLSNKATLVANPQASVGALSLTGSTLQLGSSPTNGSASVLSVNGGATIDANSTTTALINDNGSTAGTAFSQLSASGNVTVGGTLKLAQSQVNGSCVALSRGDVATLFTSATGLTGPFGNAAEGAILTLGGACPGAQVQIHYTPNSVIATVVSGTTPTTTSLTTPNPSPASTNQKVTLTATVTTNTNGNVAPAGTMAFSANGSTITGCGSQPITVSGSTGQATCSTSFAAVDSPRSLTATFNGASGQATSSSSAQNLTINKGTTKTKLGASNTSPSAGGSVTYTATVNPDVLGSTNPSGKVRFMDGGNAISGCDSQPLNGGTATCTVNYPNGGSHNITAAYLGDGSFTGSTSAATTVTVAGASHHKSTGKLLGPGGRLTVIAGRIRFTQRCQSKVLCRGSFSFTATVKGKNKKLTTVRCAAGSFRIKAGRSATIRVKLSNACLRLLRAQRHRQLTVLYTSKSSTGQVGQRKRVTLVLK